jgi:hypothetical protein
MAARLQRVRGGAERAGWMSRIVDARARVFVMPSSV